jgi:hypothetical protein
LRDQRAPRSKNESMLMTIYIVGDIISPQKKKVLFEFGRKVRGGFWKKEMSK